MRVEWKGASSIHPYTLRLLRQGRFVQDIGTHIDGRRSRAEWAIPDGMLPSREYQLGLSSEADVSYSSRFEIQGNKAAPSRAL